MGGALIGIMFRVACLFARDTLSANVILAIAAVATVILMLVLQFIA